jgi:hypothetical protein
MVGKVSDRGSAARLKWRLSTLSTVWNPFRKPCGHNISRTTENTALSLRMFPGSKAALERTKPENRELKAFFKDHPDRSVRAPRFSRRKLMRSAIAWLALARPNPPNHGVPEQHPTSMALSCRWRSRPQHQ